MIAVLFAVAVLSCGQASAAEPSIEHIRTTVEHVDQSFVGLECSFLAITETYSGIETIKRKDSGHWNIDSDGYGSFECSYELADGNQNKIVATLTNEDGGTLTKYEIIGGVTGPDKRVPGQSQLYVDRISPLNMTVRLYGRRISTLLAAGCKIVAREDWEGREVIVVDVSEAMATANRQYRLWIDAERGSVVRKVASDMGEGPTEYISCQNASDFNEVAPGVWLPSRYHLAAKMIDEDGVIAMSRRDDIRITKWVIREK